VPHKGTRRIGFVKLSINPTPSTDPKPIISTVLLRESSINSERGKRKK